MTGGPPISEEAAADQRALDRVLDAIGPLDTGAMAEAAARLDRLTKPPGSLGQLETIVIELAGITGRTDATVERGVVVVAAADHGVVRQGVSAYPSDVTAQMVANFVAGGAAINVLGGWAGLRVVVVDAGVASPIPEVSCRPGSWWAPGAGEDPRWDRRHDGRSGDDPRRGFARGGDRHRPCRQAVGRAASTCWASARWGSATRRRPAPSARS